MIKLTQTTMSTQEWAEVSDCPIQRDTSEHAKKARNKHLKTKSATHARVSAATLPNGEVYKLDGHTRCYLWQDGSLASPDYLFVDMYMVDCMADVEDLYKQFDSQDAVENASDKLRGAFRLHQFRPESSLILHGGVTSALSLLINRRGEAFNVYSACAPWIEAMRKIDGCGFSSSQFPSGVFAAMIVTVRIYGDDALKFWKAFAADEGIKNAGTKDGVQALTDLVVEKRLKRQLSGWGSVQEIASKAISCFERHRRNETYTQGVKPTDLRRYVEEKLGGNYRDAE